MSDLAAEIARLRDRVEELEHTFGVAQPPGPILDLTPTEAHLFAVLARRGTATHDQLLVGVYGSETAPPVAKVLVSRIRRKVAGLGVRIEAVYGQGYRIPDECLPAARSLIGGTNTLEGAKAEGADAVRSVISRDGAPPGSYA